MKYNTHFTDLDALQRELRGPGSAGHDGSESDEEYGDDEDDWRDSAH